MSNRKFKMALSLLGLVSAFTIPVAMTSCSSNSSTNSNGSSGSGSGNEIIVV